MSRVLDRLRPLLVPLIAFAVFLFISSSLIGIGNLLIFAVISIELYVLYRAQRNVTAWGWDLLPRPLLYLLLMPGTILHEASHVIACKLCWVQVGEVRWFKPKLSRSGTGTGDDLSLGYVYHAQTTDLRQALIGAAPLYLAPILLLVAGRLAFGSQFFSDPVSAITSGSLGMIVVWGYLAISTGQAAFPSYEDLIPPMEGAALAFLFALFLLVSGLGTTVALILLLPTLTGVLLWTWLRLLAHKRGQKPVDEASFRLPGNYWAVCASCAREYPLQELKKEGDGELPACGNCGSVVYYQASHDQMITLIPGPTGIACDGCGHSRELRFRSYKKLFGEYLTWQDTSGVERLASKPRTFRESGYYCSGCRVKKLLGAETQAFFHSSWSKHAIAVKLGTLIGNIPALFINPYDLRAAGAVSVEYLYQILTQNQDHDQAPALPPSWWISLSRANQKLLLSGRDFYAELGTAPGASKQAIKDAYRELAKTSHSDAGGSDDAMKILNSARDVLTTAPLREAFDRLDQLPEDLRVVSV